MSTMEESFRVGRRQSADRLVLELHGELDLLHAPQLEDALDDGAGDGVAVVVLDLDAVSFIDSTGLRAIFSARRLARQHGLEFAVTPGSEQVQRLLSITRLSDQLKTIPTPDETLA
jgi:anti-sigma B factor antagonist